MHRSSLGFSWPRRVLVICVIVLLYCMAFIKANTAQKTDTKIATKDGGVRNLFDVRIPMRDGVELSADIWIPVEKGKYPAILVRTPYVKAFSPGKPSMQDFLHNFATQGYVTVYQDVRGRGDSDGVLFEGDEGNDGFDTIEWIAKQPWSNGDVGMMGPSSLASLQWAAARKNPPHLRCITPTAGAHGCVGGPALLPSPWYVGGAVNLKDGIGWLNMTSGRMMQFASMAMIDWDKILWQRPLLTLDEAIGRPMPLYRKILSIRDSKFGFIIGQRLSAEDYKNINLPVLHITGWFDLLLPTVTEHWESMVKHSPAKDKQYLIIGAWDHAQTFLGGKTSMGEMEFTADSVVDIMALHSMFFAHYLMGAEESFDFPRARVYITGSNRWQDISTYPPRETLERRLYLHSGGCASSLQGDGELDWEMPGDEPADTYTYDPLQPAPAFVADKTALGPASGAPPNAEDRRPIEERDDVLVYTSAKLEEPLEILGKVYVELYASSDARDTDFTARLVDVYPDGKAVRLGPPLSGVLRARYRNGFDRPELITPGRVEKYLISLFDMGHTFLPGHRVRVEISSSAFPMIAPNQNTGNPVETDTEWKVAHQIIKHDKVYPSAVVLPVFLGKAQAKEGD